ncbi:MAG TPA: hypothetical protein VFS22_08290, partial [Flavisolibacter sp.]|nr:hypothetical protein [Flavisolibacter sp.]
MFKSKSYVKSLFVLMLISFPARVVFSQQKEQKKYNVIFILSDDHRYDFMGFMNKVPGLKTPN